MRMHSRLAFATNYTMLTPCFYILVHVCPIEPSLDKRRSADYALVSRKFAVMAGLEKLIWIDYLPVIKRALVLMAPK